jgi:hypothetical protein
VQKLSFFGEAIVGIAPPADVERDSEVEDELARAA